MSRKKTKTVYRILYTVILLKILIIKTIIQNCKSIVVIILRLIRYSIRKIWAFEIRLRVFSLSGFMFLLFFLVAYITAYFYINIYIDLPKSINIDPVLPKLTTQIFDRKGNLLYKFYNDENRSLITLDMVPVQLIQATLSIEDKDFYDHNGISLIGILRAFKKTVFNNDIEGGSTITQQLVKNKILNNEKTIIRKIREMILALKLERQYKKNDILEMYFNEINYGGTSFGIASASQMYFNKGIDNINLAEIALLAGLPASPSLYSPFSNPELAKKRQEEVLRRMLEDGHISYIEYESVIKQPLEYANQRTSIKYPHFVNYVKSELEKKFGHTLVEQGGLKVFTSIDPAIQEQAEKIVYNETIKMASHNVKNGAALISNPLTGEILAMVGSRNFWDKNIDGNVNIATSKRQPGSSIKPLNYSLAFELGFKPTDKILDAPVVYSQVVPPNFSPVNYDHKFHGLITLAQALANSYNVPAVKVLNDVGLDNFIDHAQKMGITTWTDRSRYGLSLTLGAGEVMMVDMNTAYGAFANGGYKIAVDPFIKVLASDGRELYSNNCITKQDDTIAELIPEANVRSFDCKKEHVISPLTSYQITKILSDNKLRSGAFGVNSNLDIKKKVIAVKTGTTTYEKDNWAVGYSKNFLVSTWIGNNNNEKMKNIQSGYVSASLIWRSIFDFLISSYDVDDDYELPSGYFEQTICPLTNTLACSGCQNIKILSRLEDQITKQCDYIRLKELLNKAHDMNKNTTEHKNTN